MPVRDNDKFFGRQDVLDQIRGTLGKRPGIRSFVLYGARRSGKTSVLLRIKNGAMDDSFLPIYVDMQGFAGVEPNVFLSSMARAAASVASDAGIEYEALPLPATADPGLRVAARDLVKEVARATGKNLLFLIDEYEVLLDYVKADPSLALQLQHLVESQENVYFIFAGSHALETAGKKGTIALLDTAVYLKITFLSQAEALDLVLKPGAKEGLTYADGVAEKLVEWTSGHPFYIQLLCQSLFDAAVNAGGTVTEAMLNDAVAAFQRDPSPHVILTWNGLSLSERIAGSTLAALDRAALPTEIQMRLDEEEFPSVPSAGEIRVSLGSLAAIGWVKENLDRGTFQYTMELVRRWVLSNRSINPLADEQRMLLQEKLAPAWRQLAAEIVDAVIGLIAAAPGALLSLSSLLIGIPVIVACELLVFVCPMVVGRFSVGLRLMNLYPVRREMNPLTRWQAAGYSLLMVLRGAVALAGLILLGAGLADSSLGTVWYGVAGTAILVADNLVKILTPRHRGIYERLGRVQLMYRK
jgi:hypothetical protein